MDNFTEKLNPYVTSEIKKKTEKRQTLLIFGSSGFLQQQVNEQEQKRYCFGCSSKLTKSC